MVASSLEPQCGTVRFALPADCTVRAMDGLAARAREDLASSHHLVVDGSAIEMADITLVQLLTSASRSFAARALGFAVHDLSPVARAAFHRSGVPLPPHDQSGAP